MPRTRNEALASRAAELYAGGCTAREIAGALGVTEGTVRRWLAGALRRPGRRPRASAEDDALILELRSVGPDPEREALGLPPRKPMSFAEIGQAVGMSKTGVRMRYYQLTGRQRPDRRASLAKEKRK